MARARVLDEPYFTERKMRITDVQKIAQGFRVRRRNGSKGSWLLALCLSALPCYLPHGVRHGPCLSGCYILLREQSMMTQKLCKMKLRDDKLFGHSGRKAEDWVIWGRPKWQGETRIEH